jgi:hypothetical protein
LDVALWIWNLGGVNVHAHQDAAYKGAMKNRHRSIARWLAELRAPDTRAFQEACYEGDIYRAQQLQALGVDIHADEEYAFQLASVGGHLNVVQWLWQLKAAGPYRIHEAFLSACSRGRTSVAIWLHGLDSKAYPYTNLDYVCSGEGL